MKKWRVFTTMMALFFTVACEKPLVDNEMLQDEAALSGEDSQLRKGEKTDYSDGELELGEKLTNPYSLENMKTALQNLRKQSDEFQELKIEPNYFYVRILPTNEEEFNLINSDESVDVFEYPLDYEIKKQGNKYKDKTLGNSDYTWLYCAVPTKKAFDKSLKVEVLEELFLPFGNGREDEYFKKTKSLEQEKQDFLKALENEALKITGNLGEAVSKKAKVTGWYASGKIRVWDDYIHLNVGTGQIVQGQGYMPVVQCLVRANRWFTTKTAITTSDGSFFIPHQWGTGDDVNYSIKWDRPEFDIRSGNYGQAYFNGPKQYGAWGLYIHETTPDNYIYAHVHRGAYEYYYRHFEYGLQQPPTDNNSPLGSKMHLGALQGNGRAHYFNWNGAAFAAAEIRLPFNLTDDDSRVIFGVTIHELSHASHWKIGMTYAAYCDNSNDAGRLAESWSNAVGWYVTKEVYGEQPIGPNGEDPEIRDFDHTQLMTLPAMDGGWCLNNGSWYTPLFIDLMDNYNQFTGQGGGAIPNENASGYDIQQLEGFLIAQPTNWFNYRTHLQNNSANPTENAALQLFDDYR